MFPLHHRHLLLNTRTNGLGGGKEGLNDHHFWAFVYATNPQELQASLERMRTLGFGQAADYLESLPDRQRFVKFEIIDRVNSVLKANREKPAGEPLDPVPINHNRMTNNGTESGNADNVVERCQHPMRAFEAYAEMSSRFFHKGQKIGDQLSFASDTLAVPLNQHAATRFLEERQKVGGCVVEMAGKRGPGHFMVTVNGRIFYVDTSLEECSCGIWQASYASLSPKTRSPPLSPPTHLHLPRNS